MKQKEPLQSLLFEYIEIWYNRKRRHSYLDFNSILEQEILDGVFLSHVA